MSMKVISTDGAQLGWNAGSRDMKNLKNLLCKVKENSTIKWTVENPFEDHQESHVREQKHQEQHLRNELKNNVHSLLEVTEI